MFEDSDTHNTNFSTACKTGNIELLNLLLTMDKITLNSFNEEFHVASRDGHVAIVDRLLQDKKITDLSSYNNFAIRVACHCGHVAVVDRLLQYGVDPSSSRNTALLIASENGHVDVVDRLLQDRRVDPCSYYFHSPIDGAIKNSQIAVVDRLLQDNRMDSADIGEDLIQVTRDYDREDIEELLVCFLKKFTKKTNKGDRRANMLLEKIYEKN
jgi:ankyrin repeat protein